MNFIRYIIDKINLNGLRRAEASSFDENNANVCTEKMSSKIMKVCQQFYKTQQLQISSNRKHEDFDINANSVTHLIASSFYFTKDVSVAMHLLDLSLVDAIKKKDFHSFKKIMEDILKKQPSNSDYPVNYVNPFTGDTYLDIVSRNGLTEFTVFLLYKGAKINRINETHNRGPIHFATEGGHVFTLAILLEQSTINPNLGEGQETALHIAVEKDDLKCASLLLEKGASADIPNSKGLTALRLAVDNCQSDMVELILEKSQQYLDIDTSKNDEETTRKMLRRNLPHLPLPSKYFDVNLREFEDYLVSNDETGFLKGMEFVEIEALHSVAEELLMMTVQYNCYKAAVGILGKLEGRRFKGEKVAEMATLLGRPAILEELLRIKPEMASNLILSVCQQLEMPGKRKVDMSDLLECLKLILKQKNINVRCMDGLGNTPLYYAAQGNYREVIILLLEHGSYLGDIFKGRAKCTKMF